MFDFRYHVASLAAVFIALVVGIVIGVGLTGEPLEESERVRLNEALDQRDRTIERLRAQLEQRETAEAFTVSAYPVVMENRLAGKRIAILLLGDPGDDLRAAVTLAVRDADGSVERYRALRLPIDDGAVIAETGEDDLRELGKQLGTELLDGQGAPLWSALASELVLQQDGGDEPADAIVVARTTEPQQGPTAVFLDGLYDGLTGAVPVVWIDRADEERPAPRGMETVANVGTPLGRMRLALLLAGQNPDEPIGPAEPPAEPGG